MRSGGRSLHIISHHLIVKECGPVMAKTRIRRGSAARQSRQQSRGLLAELLAGPDKHSGWRAVLGMVIRARAELTVITVLVTVYILLRIEGGMPAQWALITETTASGFLCLWR